MPASDVALTELADVCGMLAAPARLKIVLLLAKGESNVTSLCEKLKQRQPMVSTHIGLLRMNRLIVGKRKGREVIYSLAPNVKVAGGKAQISLPPFTMTLEGA